MSVNRPPPFPSGKPSTKEKPKDLPLFECVAMANEILGKNDHARVFQQWTCPHCGDRVTMETENSFYIGGIHSDPKCGKTSSILDCGFMLVLGGPGE